MRRVRLPKEAREAARFTAVVVFPQPPFWLEIAIACVSVKSDHPQVLDENDIPGLILRILGAKVKSYTRHLGLVKSRDGIQKRNLRFLPAGREALRKRIHLAAREREITPRVFECHRDIFTAARASGIKHDFRARQIDRTVKGKCRAGKRSERTIDERQSLLVL